MPSGVVWLFGGGLFFTPPEPYLRMSKREAKATTHCKSSEQNRKVQGNAQYYQFPRPSQTALFPALVNLFVPTIGSMLLAQLPSSNCFAVGLSA
jgi:hypothetical protein